MIERFLQRDTVPLTAEQWRQIDNAVIQTAKSSLIGRRFIPIYGPLGPGVQTVPLQEFEGTYVGATDLTGETECGTVRTKGISHIPLPIIHKDFMLLWRNVAGTELGLPLDLAAAASAAAFTARKEDDLIFNGDPGLGMDGLLTVKGRKTLPLSDWNPVGNAFSDVSQAIAELNRDGFFGPYALAVPPTRWAQMHGVHERTGVLEIRNVEELTTAGVFQSRVIPDNRAVVVSVGSSSMDIAIAQDMVTAALGPVKMNFEMRVFEILALRIKRPAAIASLEAG